VRPGQPGAYRLNHPALKLLPLTLFCLALFLPSGCSRDDGARLQVDAARGSYQEIRARAADLEDFFLEMEERLGQEQGEALQRASNGLIEEGRRAYDAFLKSARDMRQSYEELKALGGKNAEYADLLLALLDANQAEAMLVAESMLQVEDFVRGLPLSDPAAFTVFSQRLDDLAGRIISSRDTIRSMEIEAEELYQGI
jgi:hypothetical protein